MKLYIIYTDTKYIYIYCFSIYTHAPAFSITPFTFQKRSFPVKLFSSAPLRCQQPSRPSSWASVVSSPPANRNLNGKGVAQPKILIIRWYYRGLP